MHLEDWLERPADRLSNFWKRCRVAVLASLLFNLLVLAILLAVGISGSPRHVERSVEIAFEEELPPEEELTPDQIHERWKEAFGAGEIKSAAVDANAEENLDGRIADAKNIDAEQLYEDAARALRDIQDNQQIAEQSLDEPQEFLNTAQEIPLSVNEDEYTGPSVLSYNLPDRKALYLPIPAYKCQGGGIVVVQIEVNQAGFVIATSIDEAQSSNDQCIIDEALKAARRGRFSSTTDDSKRLQRGSITYLFVAQ